MSYSKHKAAHVMINGITQNNPPNVRTNLNLNGTFIVNDGLVTFGANTFTLNESGLWTITASFAEGLAAPFEAWPTEAFIEIILVTPIVNVGDREFGDAFQYSTTNIQLSVTVTAKFNAGDICRVTHAPFLFTQGRNGALRCLSIVKEY